MKMELINALLTVGRRREHLVGMLRPAADELLELPPLPPRTLWRVAYEVVYSTRAGEEFLKGGIRMDVRSGWEATDRALRQLRERYSRGNEIRSLRAYPEGHADFWS
jgi:hypothetical protein